MPTIYINTKNDYKSKNDSSNCEYYSNLISSEIKNALNSNAISLANNIIEREASEEIPDFSNINLQIDSENNNSSDYIISISYKSGDPQSQRLKNILEINLKNIIPENTDIKTTEAEENDFEEDVIIKINCSNEENFRWLRNNIENLSAAIIMSLTEYFGIPFIPYTGVIYGRAIKDANIFRRPSTKSEIVQTLTEGEKIKLLSQWEDWYVAEKNGILGYINTYFIDF